MNLITVKERLHQLISLESLHSWDIDEHVDFLTTLPEETREVVYEQIMAIWPVSYALCFAFLDQLPKGLTCLHHRQLSAWVNATLDIYEQSGLQVANRFLAAVETSFAGKQNGEPGLTFDQVKGRLQPYLTGLAGYEITLAHNEVSYTNTTTIYLPANVSKFSKSEDNFLLYKLSVSMQWAFLSCGLFRLQTPPEDQLIIALGNKYEHKWSNQQAWLQNFFAMFPLPSLAADLFLLAETVRATTFLKNELPGLDRDAEEIRQQLQKLRPDCSTLTGQEKIMEGLKQWILADTVNGGWATREEQIRKRAEQGLSTQKSPDASPYGSAQLAANLYADLTLLPGEYQSTMPISYVGILKPGEAEQAGQQRREKNRTHFINALAAILPKRSKIKEEAPAEGLAASPPSPLTESDEGTIIQPGREDESLRQPQSDNNQTQTYITINDEQLPLPESLQPLLREIRNDLGHIPQQYISSANQRAGSGISTGASPEPEEETNSNPNVNNYDEWDFRRNGFRKNWCTLLQKELQPVKGTFIAETMLKYRGQLRRLRHQFEMMRSQQRFVKRQRDGDDIDLDAVIEAHSDLLAGHPPSERLYIRLLRDQRNINAVFMVDMSSSTEGWISTAIKEALVLLCESLAVLGDRYAIYGFSGMRRSRGELYHIKHLDEPYNDTVRGRITAITPKDYTRMGPPIRHLTNLLAESDAKIKLLITLSDGKPEDYDDYKGDYAIEDTRHALLEAKNSGIHPFCITVDRKAHDYIAHMYGDVNYIFIDDIKKLPYRMPQIYRNLTT